MLPMSVAWLSSGILTIRRIAYRWEGLTGVHSADKVYNCLVCTVIFILIQKQISHSRTYCCLEDHTAEIAQMNLRLKERHLVKNLQNCAPKKLFLLGRIAVLHM